MAYRMGFCPQCGTQIMVQDTKGRWSTIKKNRAQADIIFDEGSLIRKVRTQICTDCLEHPNLEILIDSITDSASDASSEAMKDLIRANGAAVRIERVK